MMNESMISSVSDFQTQINQLATAQGNSLYRGQANALWPVTCSAARRLTQDALNPLRTQLIDSLLVGYLELLIARARRLHLFPPELGTNSFDLDFLAQLQHQGAATGLFDFTKESLVALWFACFESDQFDGAVFILPIAKTLRITNPKILRFPIAHFYRGNTLYSWEPTPLGERIEAQDSIFVFGNAEIENTALKKLVVRADRKEDILRELETQYCIHEEALNPDFPGYATANSPRKPFNIRRSILYWEEQVELAQDDSQLSLAFYNCGVACCAVNDLNKAIDYFDKSIEYNQNYALAYLNRGNSKSELGQHEEAILDYDRALCIDGDDFRVCGSRGDSKAKIGLLEEAIEDYGRELQLNPNSDHAYNGRGLAYLFLKNYSQAIAEFSEVIRVNPRHELAYVNRSYARSCIGSFEDALTDCNTAIFLNPESDKAFVNRGSIKLILGNSEEALADLEMAIGINPKNAEAYHNRGNAKLKLGQYKEAAVDYASAVRKDSKFASFYRPGGMVNALFDSLNLEDFDYSRFTALIQEGGIPAGRA